MKLKLSKDFFASSLKAHSWLGLFVGALMYLICLSGTIAVYYEELERWEQPSAPEYFDYDIDAIDAEFNRVINDPEINVTPHMYVTLPTEANPRVAIITENEGWFLDKAGNRVSSSAHPWTDLLTDLHLYLHLPKTWGMIFVSILGVLLLGLIISGLASHRTIFKDAFKLRVKGSYQLEQTDIHNRLSVWAAPFHIMISITGAFFGLSALVLYFYSAAFSDQSVEELTSTIYGSEPHLEQQVGHVNIKKAFEQMPELAPGTNPLFAIVHDTNTPKQFIQIFSQYPERLIYSDNFVFDASGNFISKDGFSDGEIGRQALYSVYRLHFGHFGGWWTKVIYFILGLALTVVSVSGINVWLSKRKHKDAINDAWSGFVWGTPCALLVAAISSFAINYISDWIFWFALFCCCVYSVKTKNVGRATHMLKVVGLILSLVLVIIYGLVHKHAALESISVIVNGLLLLVMIFLTAASLKKITG